ncbi:MAG: ROK family protein [Thermoplasmata archaeon]|nr:ROK family protein [Thermoplasmata archaeon]
MNVTRTYTVGVDLGATKVVAAVVDDLGGVIHAERWPTPPGSDADTVVDRIAERVEGCLQASPSAPVAVGVGVAAQADFAGTLRFSPNLRWRDVPLGPRLSRTLGVAVRVVNDVRAATLAEWRFGAARGERDLVCLFIGTGLGGGAVIDGRLVVGASNAATEFGHLTIVSDGRRCTCGNRGCLEAYVGGWAIAERARERVVADPSAGRSLVETAAVSVRDLEAVHVVRAAASGDPLARRIMDETQAYLADGLVGIANAFNPRLVVAGGGVVEGSGTWFEGALAMARSRMLPSVAEPLRYARAGLGENAVAIGAATFARAGAA